MPRLKPVTPTDDERTRLAAWTRRPKTARAAATIHPWNRSSNGFRQWAA